MLSNDDIEAWLAKFDDDERKVIEQVDNLEGWAVDSDSEVQSYFDIISSLLEQKQTINESLKDDELASMVGGISDLFGRRVTIEDLVNLQSQLSFSRSMKLFGDICYISESDAHKMLDVPSSSVSSQHENISNSILTRRIYLFLKLKLFQRVFNSERQQLVINNLKSQFNLEE
ncbi:MULTISPECIES: hypothetical protein [Vibrio]|uniref:Uncharacterized protein n=1 Tax=Vibrio tasmaniensis TaxID=212663 RepID=A0A2N7NCT1_9VIBR|nr:hypothetical protein [Vibrio tasmaniensis]PMO89873.1 hypothetical protein BCT01_00910 [Vibrio tasmaniensis]PMP09955.1 hypothetical protein BCS92_02180 [Vibrio tasmaniensis]TKG27978.1 hypothetical protein FC057_22585 [Vibrio tasmaniensis]TKG40537.1 hypothetical protein FC060_23800 [Vibrio tasmaniensis]TKG41657.1 hypothetical protein FC063_07285 [Vibrio tasmaniensis]